MEDLTTGIESLEEDDLVYLDYYIGNYTNSPNFDDLSSTWSPLSEEIRECTTDNTIDLSSFSEDYVEIVPPLQNTQSPVSGEEFLQDVRPVRKTRGISKEPYVTYDSFPPVRGKPFICEICGMKLATKESNKRHILSKHIKERRHVCGVCGKTFIFKFALKAHSAIHSDTPKFLCVCGVSFKLRTSYMNHIQRIHRAASDMKYSCELCFKSFGDRHTLRLHMISVHKPKTIPCIQEGCKKVFSSISLMRCHYRYHLNQKFTCDKCGRSFSTESYMQKHILTHSGVRPYACLDCGKTYLSVSHRNQHRRRICHASARLYQCSFCGKRFKTKDLLSYHESNHRGEKPFKCEVCGYATAYKNTYYAHRKKHLSSGGPPDAAKKKEAVASISNADGRLKGSDTIEAKSRHRKTHPPLKPKVNVGKDNRISLSGKRRERLRCVVSNSVNVVPPPTPCSSSSSSSSSLSFSSPPSTLSVAKQANVDFLIFPPSVLNCSEHQVSEPLLDSSVQLSMKCVDSDINLITYNKDHFGSDEQCMKDNIDLGSKECIDGQAVVETEKSDSSIILSNNGRCSISECESVDDSLLLVKIGENSFAGVCAYHTVSDEAEISELNLNSVENLTLTTVDSKCLGTDLITGSNALSIRSPITSVNSVQKQGTIANDPKISMVSPCKSSESILDLNSVDQSTTFLIECDPAPMVDTISLPLTQPEVMKPSSSEVCHSEDMAPVAEIDTGMPSLSGHIVDDSFHLAQLEVVCPLCDEQFFCMDTYITHLECIHN